MRPRASYLLALAPLLAACAAPDERATGNVFALPGERPLPSLAQATLAWDTAQGSALAFDEMCDRLASADVVFVGETHVDDTTHRVEEELLARLAEKRKGKVVLSLEMFERDVQQVLDAYLAGQVDEKAFLAKARPWRNYRTGYRPLVEFAKRAGIPVIAANAPTALRRKLSRAGRTAYDGLSATERSWLPPEILPASAAYWERVDRAVRGHGGGSVKRSADQLLFSGQNLWDNCMGHACARALDAHPGSLVLHVAGSFHVNYRDGTVAQLLARRPSTKTAVVSVLASSGLQTARPERERERGDFLVYASPVARGLFEGTHAVHVPGELRFTMDLPAGASEADRVPLVVWLTDSASRPEDARAYWRLALGEEAAVACVLPSYPGPATDLARVGRWVHADGFRADYARLTAGLERLVEYVTRRMPVDPKRVLVAGRGTGGTVALWAAMHSQWLDARFVAVEPSETRRLMREGLPDRPSVARGLRIAVADGRASKADAILDRFREIGTSAELAVWRGQGSGLRRFAEVVLREDLGLEPMRPAKDDAFGRSVQFFGGLGPRMREWVELYARSDASPGVSHIRRVMASLEPAALADGQVLPLPGGSFGGTTVLVVPSQRRDLDAWRALEKANPLRKRSRFASLRVAFETASPSLAAVLRSLRKTGRRRVLVAPAAFCWHPKQMRDLRASVAGEVEGLDLTWLPGLGGELWRLTRN